MSFAGEPQNVYDDPEFFAAYTQLPRFNAPFGAAMEHGAFLEMTGDVTGMDVLDLGCGGGQLAYRLAESGASHVTAIDASSRMLAVATTLRPHPRIDYARATLEEASYPAACFDLVVSSLAVHYVEDYPGLVRRIAEWLRAGGMFVFSTEHPIYAARGTEDGWVKNDGGSVSGWALDDYAIEGPREHRWFSQGVRRYHRTLATILNSLIEGGFVLDRLYESHPTKDWLRTRPDDAQELRRPMFLLVKAHKLSSQPP